jgi:uncharacterized membrane protein
MGFVSILRTENDAANATTQYWVTFAFLTVFESAVSAVYWFRMCSQPTEERRN